MPVKKVSSTPSGRASTAPVTTRTMREGRPPRQSRGIERKASLIDAAAAIIAEAGVEGLSMQALAARAGATTGSIYHFFDGRDGVLRALNERYSEEFRAINARLMSTSTETWSRMGVEQFVHAYFAPVSEFLKANRAFVVLGADGAWAHPAVDEAQSRRVAAHLVKVLAARWPGAKLADVRMATQILFSMGDGIFKEMARATAPQAVVLFGEFTVAAGAYLRAKSANWR
jgi:AcrR family transcriptional regulator